MNIRNIKILRVKALVLLGIIAVALIVLIKNLPLGEADQYPFNQHDAIEFDGGAETVPGIIDSNLKPQEIAYKQEHMNALMRIEAAIPDLRASDIPIMGINYREGYIDEPEITKPYEVTITSYMSNIIFEVGLREVRPEYKDAIKAIAGDVEGLEFDFFQADFTHEEIISWQDRIVDKFIWDKKEAGEVPFVIGTSSSFLGNITVYLVNMEPEYIEAIKNYIGEDAPLVFTHQQ